MLAYEDLDGFRMRSRSEIISRDAVGAEISFPVGDNLEHCAKTATSVEAGATQANCFCDEKVQPTF